ncbi:MAG: HypC/HybG/HupF family hydrogenase formation chaperone [Bacillota bacterium]
MCLAVPARVTMIEGIYAEIELFGNTRRIGISLVPMVQVGDYVLVHAGYALHTIDEKEALETLRLLEEVYGTLAEI